jgi:hypothetical protein
MQSQLAQNLRPLITDHDTLNGYKHIMESLQSGRRKNIITRSNTTNQKSLHPKNIIPAAEISIRPVYARKIDLKKTSSHNTYQCFYAK